MRLNISKIYWQFSVRHEGQMPLIFNSVTQFVETIGRRRTHVSNPTQLDSLECIFTGPTELATGFVPLDLARHPQFPGMQCSGWTITNREALMAEARAQYSGKFTAGAGPYTTVPVITCQRHLGEVSYTDQFSTSAQQIETLSWTVRFTARGVTFKYLQNYRPDPNSNGLFASQAQPYLGTENVNRFTTGRSFETGVPSGSASTGFGGHVSASLVFTNDLTDLQVSDLANGWFEVQETFLTQPHINTSVV
jgi:hypothetical protein